MQIRELLEKRLSRYRTNLPGPFSQVLQSVHYSPVVDSHPRRGDGPVSMALS
jgi:hypothetical protein